MSFFYFQNIVAHKFVSTYHFIDSKALSKMIVEGEYVTFNSLDLGKCSNNFKSVIS